MMLRYLIRLPLFMLLTSLLLACKQSNSLEAFASEVPKAMARGASLTNYLASSLSLSPEKRLALHYKNLLQNWDYQADPPGYDHFRSVEDLINNKTFAGDCEDFAIVMLSICQALELHCQLVLGKNQEKGHIWTEVLLTRHTISPATQTKITRAFGRLSSQIQRSNGYWLQLSPEGSLKKYTATQTIDPLGRLQKIK